MGETDIQYTIITTIPNFTYRFGKIEIEFKKIVI